MNKLRDKVGFLRPSKENFKFWGEVLEACKVLRAPICLIQLPASFKENEENFKNAEEFFSMAKRNGISIALELRGWSKEGFKRVCKKFDLISCVDPFKSEPVWFSKRKIAYFRLHGSPPGKQMYKYKYTLKDLRKLKEKVESLRVKEVYVFFNNIFMFEDAKRFSRLLGSSS